MEIWNQSFLLTLFVVYPSLPDFQLIKWRAAQKSEQRVEIQHIILYGSTSQRPSENTQLSYLLQQPKEFYSKYVYSYYVESSNLDSVW